MYINDSIALPKDENKNGSILIQKWSNSSSSHSVEMKFLKAGIFWTSKIVCNSNDVNHDVFLIIIYGAVGNTPYWILKNSQGKIGAN